jgi:zinc and cadmium transporter
MENVWFNSIVSVVIVSLLSFVGIIFLAFKSNFLQRIIFILVSFAVGAMLGGAFFHLIPEVYEKSTNFKEVSVVIILGILAFFILEKFLHWHHDHNIEDKEEKVKPLGFISLAADSFHNLIDGILIGSAYLVDPTVGIATTFAVIIHEIPQEIGDFGVLIHSGFKVKKALLFNFLSACSSIIGAIVAIILGNSIEGFEKIIIAFAIGGFIYLAGSDLIPELHKKNSAKSSIIQLIAIIAGLVLMYSFTLIGHTISAH